MYICITKHHYISANTLKQCFSDLIQDFLISRSSYCVLWVNGNFKWTVSKWKRVWWSDESKSDVGNLRHCLLQAKEDHVISVFIWYGQLACFGRQNTERYATVLEQQMLHSRDLFQGRSCVSINNQKICQRPQTLQQLETYIWQEWDQNPTAKLSNR